MWEWGTTLPFEMDWGRLRGKRNAYKIFVGKSEDWRPVVRFRYRYDWIQVAGDREQWPFLWTQ
jgi:hypothetical protein